MLNQLTRKEWISKSSTANPKGLRAKAVFGIPAVEINQIYSPICEKILSVKESRTSNKKELKSPLILGVTGSVAIGKTTLSNILKEILEKAPYDFETVIVSTDNFLFPNRVLEERQNLHRKGFPESFQYKEILRFLKSIKKRDVISIPTYSHETYDITEKMKTIRSPEILILEGINILQDPPPSINQIEPQTIRDFIDFSIYLDAEEPIVKQWYIERFLSYCNNARYDSTSFFTQFKDFTEKQASELAKSIWESINSPNLKMHIGPSITHADLVLFKEHDHTISRINIPSNWF